MYLDTSRMWLKTAVRSLLVVTVLSTTAAWATSVAPAQNAPVQVAAAAQKAAVASFVKGDVEVSASEKGPWQKVKRNADINAGSFIRTGENARLELKFADSSIIRVGASSQLVLNVAGYDGKTKEINVEATVVAGKTWSKVSTLINGESKSKFEVKTAHAVAGVRGTVFRVDSENDDASVVKVYSGAVAVAAPTTIKVEDPKKNCLSPVDPACRGGQVAAPAQVTKKQWEELVGKMMQIKVGKTGVLQSATPFTDEEDKQEDPQWVQWNQARDGGDEIYDY